MRARVWYWNGEDPLEEIQRRVAAIAVHYGLAAHDLEGWLFIDSGRDQKIVVATQTRDGAKIVDPVVNALIETIRLNQIDVVIIDPFISSHRITENDNNAIDLVAKKWNYIAEVTNCAIELVHHTRKTGGAEASIDDSRGGGALIGAVRAAQVLNRMSNDEAKRIGVESPRKYFKVEDGKQNLTPPLDGYEWYQIVEVHLGNGLSSDNADLGDGVGVVTAWKFPNPLDGVTGDDFEAVAHAIRGGRWRENIQAKDWVGRAVAQALHLDLDEPSGRAKANSLVKTWLLSGSLVLVESLDEKSMVRKYVEVRDELSPHLASPWWGASAAGVAARPPSGFARFACCDRPFGLA